MAEAAGDALACGSNRRLNPVMEAAAFVDDLYQGDEGFGEPAGEAKHGEEGGIDGDVEGAGAAVGEEEAEREEEEEEEEVEEDVEALQFGKGASPLPWSQSPCAMSCCRPRNHFIPYILFASCVHADCRVQRRHVLVERGGWPAAPTGQAAGRLHVHVRVREPVLSSLPLAASFL